MSKRNVEYIGIIAGKSVGVEILPTDKGGWDVVACVLEDGEWLSIGNAEEVNNFMSVDAARTRGIEILEEELGNHDGKVRITWETADWTDDGGFEWIPQSAKYDIADVAYVVESLRLEGCNRNIKIG